ncbi:MAG: hypothetical protein KBA31_01900 [Alphaproteobacteria bacterium]|nr:hypothetical protein [Alphaproteobacteria bacterium]
MLDGLFGKPKKKRKRPAKKRSAFQKALGVPAPRKRRKPQSAAKKVENAVERAVSNAVGDMFTAAIKKITG